MEKKEEEEKFITPTEAADRLGLLCDIYINLLVQDGELITDRSGNISVSSVEQFVEKYFVFLKDLGTPQKEVDYYLRDEGYEEKTAAQIYGLYVSGNDVSDIAEMVGITDLDTLWSLLRKHMMRLVWSDQCHEIIYNLKAEVRDLSDYKNMYNIAVEDIKRLEEDRDKWRQLYQNLSKLPEIKKYIDQEEITEILKSKGYNDIADLVIQYPSTKDIESVSILSDKDLRRIEEYLSSRYGYSWDCVPDSPHPDWEEPVQDVPGLERIYNCPVVLWDLKKDTLGETQRIILGVLRKTTDGARSLREFHYIYPDRADLVEECPAVLETLMKSIGAWD